MTKQRRRAPDVVVRENTRSLTSCQRRWHEGNPAISTCRCRRCGSRQNIRGMKLMVRDWREALSWHRTSADDVASAPVSTLTGTPPVWVMLCSDTCVRINLQQYQFGTRGVMAFLLLCGLHHQKACRNRRDKRIKWLASSIGDIVVGEAFLNGDDPYWPITCPSRRGRPSPGGAR